MKAADAYEQIRTMIGTMDDSPFDFAMEVSANRLTFFLSFAFWKAAGAGRLGVDAVQLARCLDLIRSTWPLAPRPGALVEEASIPAWLGRLGRGHRWRERSIGATCHPDPDNVLR